MVRFGKKKRRKRSLYAKRASVLQPERSESESKIDTINTYIGYHGTLTCCYKMSMNSPWTPKTYGILCTLRQFDGTADVCH